MPCGLIVAVDIDIARIQARVTFGEQHAACMPVGEMDTSGNLLAHHIRRQHSASRHARLKLAPPLVLLRQIVHEGPTGRFLCGEPIILLSSRRSRVDVNPHSGVSGICELDVPQEYHLNATERKRTNLPVSRSSWTAPPLQGPTAAQPENTGSYRRQAAR